MVRVRTAAVLAALALALVLPAAANASATNAMIGKINAYRAAHGERPLRVSGSLMHSATSYSEYCMSTGFFGHLSRIRASSRFHTLGEILEIHTGDAAKIALTFRDWINSPEHRAVILYPSFRWVGAGFTEGRFHGLRATIWVMHFGR
jgi:uncharacterized protein YkwD